MSSRQVKSAIILLPYVLEKSDDLRCQWQQPYIVTSNVPFTHKELLNYKQKYNVPEFCEYPVLDKNGNADFSVDNRVIKSLYKQPFVDNQYKLGTFMLHVSDCQFYNFYNETCYFLFTPVAFYNNGNDVTVAIHENAIPDNNIRGVIKNNIGSNRLSIIVNLYSFAFYIRREGWKPIPDLHTNNYWQPMGTCQLLPLATNGCQCL